MMIGSRRWSQRVSLAGAALAPVLGGCSGGEASAPILLSSPNLAAPSQAPAVPSASGQDERRAVEVAYTRFWPRSVQVGQEPEDTWPDAVAAIAVDPQLSTTLSAMRQQKAVGITTYGEVTVRISAVEVTGDTAMVVDCQDASHAGQADATTGDRKTVGVPRMPVHAMLLRGTAEERWKVSRLDFPGGAC